MHLDDGIYIDPTRLHSAPRGVVETLASLDAMVASLAPEKAEDTHNAREVIRLVAEGLNWFYCQRDGGPNPALHAADPEYPNYVGFRPYEHPTV